MSYVTGTLMQVFKDEKDEIQTYFMLIMYVR